MKYILVGLVIAAAFFISGCLWEKTQQNDSERTAESTALGGVVNFSAISRGGSTAPSCSLKKLQEEAIRN